MKLNFKVADVKQKVAATNGFEAANIKLIWSGKILADANEIGSYEIKPADHIVCMVQKPKAAPVASKAPSTPAPVAAQTPSAPAPAPASAPASGNAPATPSPAPANTATTANTRQFNDPSSMTLGAERQAAISNMEAMGFERAQCERALRAAYYNADRAVEYLLTGIPESAEPQNPQQSSGGTVPPPAQAAQTAQPTTATTDDEAVNLFEAAAAAGSRGAGRGSGAGNPGAGGAAAGSGAGVGGAGSLDFLRGNGTFQHLRQVVQQNPAMMDTVLQQVANSNPQLAQLIASQPEAFMQLLMEGAGEEGDVPLPPGAQSVSVTEAERDAIERLCRLGFDRDLVIQAYFACDKNEELAANFLFENPENDEPGQ